MMQIERIAAFGVEGEAGKPHLSFSTYSKFKYGHKPSAMIIARAMRDAMLSVYPIEWFAKMRDSIVITTSPYWYAQPAAHALATHVLTELNVALLRAESPPLKYVRIHRSSAPSCDFGSLSAEEREKNMNANALSADADVFRGKTVFVVEDARITGAHEKKIVSYMETIGVEKLIFVYGVVVENGTADPKIEHRMNHHVIQDLEVLHDLMRHYDRYVLNSRVCRFILERGGTPEFNEFLEKVSDSTLTDIFRYSINDGYGMVPKYREGMLAIHDEIIRRGDHLIHEEELVLVG